MGSGTCPSVLWCVEGGDTLTRSLFFYLVLVALHLLLQEGLPGHLLEFLSQVLTRLHVGLGDVLGQVFWNGT